MADKNLTIQLGVQDNASGPLNSFQGSLQRIAEFAAGAALERIGEQLLDIGKTAVEYAVQTASSFEQWKIAFDAMLGSADKSSKLMSQISDFAQKTPFTLPTLVEGSKQLIAFGVSADDVVGKLGQLGDISAAIGTDRLPLLIHAYGQVVAGQRLTGREMNEFVMSGVPLMQTLADHFNKVGLASEGMGTTIEKGTKMSASAMQSMNNKIQDTQMRLQELAMQHPKTAAAQLSHDDAVAKATRNLEQYQDKLSGANKIVTTFGESSKVTAMDVKKMIEDNKVSLDDVNAALSDMTGKGGRFFDMMNKQSQTFGGIISNIQDQFSRIALGIMGFDMVSNSPTFGQIKDGTIFSNMHKAVELLLDFLNAHAQDISKFFNDAFTAVVNFGKSLYEIFQNLKPIIEPIGKMFADQWKWFISDGGDRVRAVLIAIAIVIGTIVIPVVYALAAGVVAATWPILLIVGVITVLAYAFLKAIPYIESFAKYMATEVPKILSDTIKWFSQLPTEVEKFLVDLFEKKIPFYIGFIAGYLSVEMPKIYRGIISFFERLPGDTGGHMTNLYNVVINKFTEIWSWIATEIPQWPGRIEAFLQSIPGFVHNILVGLNTAVDNDLKAVWQTATNWWNNIRGIFDGIVNAAGNALAAAQKAFSAGFTSGANVAKRASGGYASGLTLVGEMGPELVSLPQGSYVHNNNETKNMMGGAEVHIEFSGPVNMDSSDRVQELANQIIKILGRQNELAAKGLGI